MYQPPKYQKPSNTETYQWLSGSNLLVLPSISGTTTNNHLGSQKFSMQDPLESPKAKIQIIKSKESKSQLIDRFSTPDKKERKVEEPVNNWKKDREKVDFNFKGSISGFELPVQKNYSIVNFVKNEGFIFIEKAQRSSENDKSRFEKPISKILKNPLNPPMTDSLNNPLQEKKFSNHPKFSQPIIGHSSQEVFLLATKPPAKYINKSDRTSRPSSTIRLLEFDMPSISFWKRFQTKK